MCHLFLICLLSEFTTSLSWSQPESNRLLSGNSKVQFRTFTLSTHALIISHLLAFTIYFVVVVVGFEL